MLVDDCIDTDGLIMEKAKGSGEHFVIRNVDKFRITTLLDRISISKYSAFFDTAQLSQFISGCSDSVLEKWDIAFIDGVNSDNTVEIRGHEIKMVRRDNCEIDKGERLKIGQRGKLGGPSDGRICVSDEAKLKSAEEEYSYNFV